MNRTTVQVATEAIINENGDGYELSTMTTVFADAVDALGEQNMYVQMLAAIIRERLPQD